MSTIGEGDRRPGRAVEPRFAAARRGRGSGRVQARGGAAQPTAPRAAPAAEGGVVVPPRYYSHWEPGDGVRNEQAIQRFFLRLADRVTALLDQGTFPLVLGGDCSILLGNMLALRRRGRYGLIFIDAHSDLRHPGNSDAVGSAAGEDLAPVTGRGDVLANLEGRRPLVLDGDVVAIGVRSGDEALGELKDLGIQVRSADDMLRAGAAATAQEALAPSAPAASTASGSTATSMCWTPRCCPRSTPPNPVGSVPSLVRAAARAARGRTGTRHRDHDLRSGSRRGR